MNFLDKLKRCLTKPRANVSLKLERRNFFSGGTLKATLYIEPFENFEAEEIRAVLEGIERVKAKCDSLHIEKPLDELRKKGQSSFRELYLLDKNDVSWGKVIENAETIYNQKFLVTGKQLFPANERKVFHIQLDLPSNLPPTYRGVRAITSYKLTVTLNIKGRPDLSETREVEICSPCQT